MGMVPRTSGQTQVLHPGLTQMKELNTAWGQGLIGFSKLSILLNCSCLLPPCKSAEVERILSVVVPGLRGHVRYTKSQSKLNSAYLIRLFL